MTPRVVTPIAASFAPPASFTPPATGPMSARQATTRPELERRSAGPRTPTPNFSEAFGATFAQTNDAGRRSPVAPVPPPAAPAAASTVFDATAHGSLLADILQCDRAESAGSREQDRNEMLVKRKEEEASAVATERMTAKLAELGIDPEGMTAGEILQMLYARGSGSSYWLQNREAAAQCQQRVQTPRTFDRVLNPSAIQQIRRARDMPAANVHECLDHWEIDFLADSCRSLKHVIELSEGPVSEYSRSFQHGRPLGTVPRKKFVRQII